jgi:hypothetical protein
MQFQSHELCTADLKMQLQAVTEVQGWLEILDGHRHFISCISDEATQTVWTDFFECILNPSTNSRSWSVLFKYILYNNPSRHYIHVMKDI